MRALAGLPQLRIDLGGAGLQIRPEAILSVRVQQRLSLPSLCELRVADPDGELSRASLDVGLPLRVDVGAFEEPLFEGDLTAVEYACGPARQRELRLRGYDRLHRLRMNQPVRAHVEVSAADLARELAGPLGLEVTAATDGPVWPFLVQWHQSDLELLADVAARAGLYLALRGTELRLLTLEGSGDPLPLHAGENLPECAVEVNADSACRQVSAAGWDLASVALREGRASDPRVGRSVAAEASPSSVGGDGTRTLAGALAPTADHAESAAQAELDRRACAEVVLRGAAEGDPRLRPGARVELGGVPSAVAGTYVLTAATHTLDPRRGFLSELSTDAPEPPRPAPAPFATVGEVSRIDGGSGRVKVALPAFGGVETDWMQVVSPGGGKDKGLAMLPDGGDRVLVLYTSGDPGQGVVLGGLYGADGPKDAGVEAGSVRRFTLRTAAGHVVRLDDSNRTLRVEDPTGSWLELAPSRVRLHAATPLDIEAPGQPIVIRGKTVDFRRG